MTEVNKAHDQQALIILRQAELVALEVAKAEAIVDHAIGAAAMAMAATGATGTSELTDHARETLHVARSAAAKVLQVQRKKQN